MHIAISTAQQVFSSRIRMHASFLSEGPSGDPHDARKSLPIFFAGSTIRTQRRHTKLPRPRLEPIAKSRQRAARPQRQKQAAPNFLTRRLPPPEPPPTCP